MLSNELFLSENGNQSEIDELKRQIASLNGQTSSLNGTISSLRSQNSSLQSQLSKSTLYTATGSGNFTLNFNMPNNISYYSAIEGFIYTDIRNNTKNFITLPLAYFLFK